MGVIQGSRIMPGHPAQTIVLGAADDSAHCTVGSGCRMVTGMRWEVCLPSPAEYTHCLKKWGSFVHGFCCCTICCSA